MVPGATPHGGSLIEDESLGNSSPDWWMGLEHTALVFYHVRYVWTNVLSIFTTPRLGGNLVPGSMLVAGHNSRGRSYGFGSSAALKCRGIQCESFRVV